MNITEELGTLFHRDRVAVRKIILEYQKDFNEVDDWMQDTFLRAFERRDQFDESKSSLLTWVCNIAKSVCINHIEEAAAAKRPELILASCLESCTTEDGSSIDYYDRALQSPELMGLCHGLDPAGQVEAIDAVATAISDMPPRMAEALLLRYEGYTSAEIADQMGTSASTVDSQIAVAKQIITDLLEI